jgi:hypothetical protein
LGIELSTDAEYVEIKNLMMDVGMMTLLALLVQDMEGFVFWPLALICNFICSHQLLVIANLEVTNCQVNTISKEKL